MVTENVKGAITKIFASLDGLYSKDELITISYIFLQTCMAEVAKVTNKNTNDLMLEATNLLVERAKQTEGEQV